MNRQDTIDLSAILATHANALADRYREMPEGNKTQKQAKARLGRELDRAVTLFKKLKIPTPTARTAPKTVRVGTCPCGADITLGTRYSVTTEGVTRVARACPSCNRQNEVELRVSRSVKVADWTVRECFCGSPVRLRSDYAGSGFTGYRGGPDFLGRTRKNRTATVKCSGCPCKWTVQVRFSELTSGPDQGKTVRTLPSMQVVRCRSCAMLDAPGFSPVEPKKKAAR